MIDAQITARTLAVGGLFKTERVVSAMGRQYLRLTVGSGGAQCLDRVIWAFRGRPYHTNPCTPVRPRPLLRVIRGGAK